MKQLLITLLTLFVSTASFAGDIIPLQMGEVFTVKNNGTDVWAITPTESGTMKIVGDNGDGEWIGSCLNVYDDESMTNQVQSYNWTYYEVVVTAGHTYYIKTWNMSGQDYKGKCVMADSFKFTGSDPAAGSPFTVLGDSEVRLYFTAANVTFTEGELFCNGNTVKIYNFTDFNELVSNGIFTYTEEGTSGMVNYNGCVLGHQDNDGITIPFITQTGHEQINVLYEMLSTGKIATGQDMTLTMHGVKNALTDELLGGNGEMEVKWTVGEMPTSLVSARLPETFLSYWVPGDEDGIAVFEFSREIKSAQALIGMGYADANDRFEDNVETIIEGKTVKIDFTGLIRDAGTMGLNSIYPNMEVLLYNVIDVNGNGTYAGDQGRASSYEYTLPYRNVSGVVSYEITPTNGTRLTEDVTEIEIWYQDINELLDVDGVEISYLTGEGEEISVFYGDQDPNITWWVGVDGTTITIPVSDEMRAAYNVCVRLNIVKTRDGRSHDIVAYYNTSVSNEWEIAHMADKAGGSTIHRLNEIVFTLNSTYSINNSINTPHATVYNADDDIVCVGMFESCGMTNVKLVFDHAITEAGTYTVRIIEGAVGDYIFGYSHYTSGTCNPATTLTYTVSGKWAGKTFVTDPEEGHVESLSSIDIISFEYDIAPSWNVEAMPYVEDNAGNKVLGKFSETQEQPDRVTITLETPVTATGAYTLVYPSGSLTNASTGDPIQAELSFKYTILPDRIRSISGTSAAPAYNLNGQRVKPNAKGIYIRNGKKYVK